MEIEKYEFGMMVIDGKKYTSDLMIFENEIKSNWWRKEGHFLHLEDLNWVLNRKPNLIIIGTGNSGIMKVPDILIEELNSKGIKVMTQKTQKAVRVFNEKSNQKKIAAGFHLTC